MAEKRRIITVGREFGSGGRELGRLLAETLGIEYYDREIITKIAEHTDLSEDYIHEVTENGPTYLMPISVGHSFSYSDIYSILPEHSVYEAQNKILREMAEKSDCVIIGRGADYVLKDFSPYRIFVYASMESRINRCMARETGADSLDRRSMEKMIKKIDRARSRYYDFSTGLRWGDKENYDLCINTTDANIKDTVSAIAKIFIKE